jgi:DNA transposition AAA+ family ATPase
MTTPATIAPAAPAQTERQLNRIPGPKVVEATADLPPDQRQQILWLHTFYWEQQIGLDDCAKKIGYDGGTLSKVFRGVYEGNLAQVVDAIVKFRALLNDRASINKVSFIRTQLFGILEESCNALRTYQKMGFVYGESQVGKTKCLKEYAAMEQYNHGRTVYIEMPVGGSLSSFMAELARKVKVGAQQKSGDLRSSIKNAFTDDMVLIVDEASRAAVGGKQTSKTLDFIRAIYDHAQCGVLLCGTNIFREQMANDAMEPFLRQLHRRVLFRRQLPDRPTRADLNAIAAHYGLSPASEEAYQLQKETIMRHGLGVWLTTLTAAARAASKRNNEMTWTHVIKAHAFLKKLEQSPASED